MRPDISPRIGIIDRKLPITLFEADIILPTESRGRRDPRPRSRMTFSFGRSDGRFVRDSLGRIQYRRIPGVERRLSGKDLGIVDVHGLGFVFRFPRTGSFHRGGSFEFFQVGIVVGDG